MVPEQQPAGPECRPLCPSPFEPAPPMGKSRQLPRPSHPLRSMPQFLNPSVLLHAPPGPCPGCRDLHTESQGWLHARVMGMLLAWGAGGTPAGLGQGQQPPQHPNKRTDEIDRNGGAARAAGGGQRLPEGRGSSYECTGPGTCGRKGEREPRAVEGDGRKEKEQSCSVGQIFCCFIRFSVNQLVFARTGVRRGVSKREECERRSGKRASPAARAFTSQSSSVQTLRN